MSNHHREIGFHRRALPPLASSVLILKGIIMKYSEKTNLGNKAFITLEASNLEFNRIIFRFCVPVWFSLQFTSVTQTLLLFHFATQFHKMCITMGKRVNYNWKMGISKCRMFPCFIDNVNISYICTHLRSSCVSKPFFFF